MSSYLLHGLAMQAYAAASDYGRAHPNPSPEEWNAWKELCEAATQLNEAFLAAAQEERRIRNRLMSPGSQQLPGK
jgi:hypothetical protein